MRGGLLWATGAARTCAWTGDASRGWSDTDTSYGGRRAASGATVLNPPAEMARGTSENAKRAGMSARALWRIETEPDVWVMGVSSMPARWVSRDSRDLHPTPRRDIRSASCKKLGDVR